jgi:hypothetical protein
MKRPLYVYFIVYLAQEDIIDELKCDADYGKSRKGI